MTWPRPGAVLVPTSSSRSGAAGYVFGRGVGHQRDTEAFAAEGEDE